MGMGFYQGKAEIESWNHYLRLSRQHLLCKVPLYLYLVSSLTGLDSTKKEILFYVGKIQIQNQSN